MFERFTDTARRAIVLAQEEARLLGHDWIGTEHLLLGILHGGDPIAGQALADVGLDLSGLRERVNQAVGVQENHAPAGHIPFTPRSKKVLEMSLREAIRLQHNYIGPEHLLLALVAEGSGVASQVLISESATPDDLRGRIDARMAASPGPTAAPSAEAELRQRITELEHRVAELERRLGGPGTGTVHGDVVG
ncbi:Clp protease N-terminal domain-containing protein [Nocardia sp. NPDC101769]|uniref:Clp protease N-terminal domain-containing protein n=1 Tax=Nocardia sp. NPDC101769 TaxID=3364333 RepID=UPI00382C7E24